MLDPWIIEEIRRREEEERKHQRPVVHIETPQLPADRGGVGSGEKQPGEERGVAIIDFTIG